MGDVSPHRRAPILSIVVPVRGRFAELSVLLTLLRRLPSSGVEIVVADNSGPDFRSPPEWLGDDERFIWRRPPGPLHMTDNFEFGASFASGDWIMFLGADDGILPSNFTMFADLLHSSTSGSVTTLPVGFFWPNTWGHENGRLSWIAPRDRFAKLRTYNSSKALRTLRRQTLVGLRDTGIRLPRPYMLGAVRSDLVRRIRDKHAGRLFVGPIPDVFLTCAILKETSTFDVGLMNFGIQGASQSSNGLLGLDATQWLARPDNAFRSTAEGAALLGDPHEITNVHAQYLDVLFNAGGRRRKLTNREWAQLRRWGAVTGLGEIHSGACRSAKEVAQHGPPAMGLVDRHVRRGLNHIMQRWLVTKELRTALLAEGATYWRTIGGNVPDTECAASLVESAQTIPLGRGASQQTAQGDVHLWCLRRPIR